MGKAGLIAAILGLALLIAGAAAAQQPPGTPSPITQRLFEAVFNKDLGAVQASIAAGANVSARNEWGLTPIDVAVDKGYFEIAHYLLSERNFRAARKSEARPAQAPLAAKPAPRPAPSTATPQPAPQPAHPPEAVSAQARATQPPPPWPVDKPNPFDPAALPQSANLPMIGDLQGPDLVPRPRQPSSAASSQTAGEPESSPRLAEAQPASPAPAPAPGGQPEPRAEKSTPGIFSRLKAVLLPGDDTQVPERAPSSEGETLAAAPQAAPSGDAGEPDARHEAPAAAETKTADPAPVPAGSAPPIIGEAEGTGTEAPARQAGDAEPPGSASGPAPMPPATAAEVASAPEPAAAAEAPRTAEVSPATEAGFFRRLTDFLRPDVETPAGSVEPDRPPSPEASPAPDAAPQATETIAGPTPIVEAGPAEPPSAPASEPGPGFFRRLTDFLRPDVETPAGSVEPDRPPSPEASPAPDAAPQATGTVAASPAAPVETASAPQPSPEAEPRPSSRAQPAGRTGSAAADPFDPSVTAQRFNLPVVGEIYGPGTVPPPRRLAAAEPPPKGAPAATGPRPKSAAAEETAATRTASPRAEAIAEDQPPQETGTVSRQARPVTASQKDSADDETAASSDEPVETARVPPPAAPKAPLAAPGRILSGVVLTLGRTVRLGNAPTEGAAEARRPKACLRKREGALLYCIIPVDWPTEIEHNFDISSFMYHGAKAIVRYDEGDATSYFTLFATDSFEAVTGYYERRFGPPSETWDRRIAPLGAPRQLNPTVVWRSADPATGVATTLEVRKYDDARGGFPDIRRGVILLRTDSAKPIFPQLSALEMMSAR